MTFLQILEREEHGPQVERRTVEKSENYIISDKRQKMWRNWKKNSAGSTITDMDDTKTRNTQAITGPWKELDQDEYAEFS